MNQAGAPRKPQVSVVIPHYNRSELLKTAVDSVLSSSEREFEVIIVDDGSSDEHVRGAAELQSDRVRFIARSSGPKGPSRCRNLGVEASEAERIVFLDSDDIMASWCLETRLAAAKTAPEKDLLVFPVLLFDQTPGDSDRLWNRMDNGLPPALRFVRSDPPWHTSSPLWKKSAFIATGGFNENVFYGDDSDLHMRALIEGRTVGPFPDALPDVFVRRSSAPRITNSPSGDLAASRRARLEEGTKFLKASADRSKFLEPWAGQYFAEAEFWLFNTSAPRQAVEEVLAQWERDFGPSGGPSAVAKAYFEIAIRSREHAYLLLRAARRTAMKLLPRDFFPLAPDLETWRASRATMAALVYRLRNSGTT